MLTKYGKKAVQFTNNGAYPLFYANPSPQKGVIPFKNPSGEDKFYSMFTRSNSDYPTTSTSSNGVCIGSGNTPATENDYQLESMITQNVAITRGDNQVYRWDFENNKFYVGFDYTIANNGSESIEIKEVGKIASAYTSSTLNGNATSNESKVLIDRTILTAPVIIPAGESGVVRYEFEYDFSSSVE